MLRDLAMKYKLGFGFGAILLLTMMVGGIAIWSISEIEAHSAQQESVTKFSRMIREADASGREFVNTFNFSYADQSEARSKQAVSMIKSIMETINDTELEQMMENNLKMISDYQLLFGDVRMGAPKPNPSLYFIAKSRNTIASCRS